MRRSAETGGHVRRMPAWLLPALVFGGFLMLFLALFRDHILPAVDAEVAVVLASSGPAAAAGEPGGGGRLIFQASGWIEPDPLPVKATALIGGVVETVHLREGDVVRKGDPLVSLIQEDAELALEQARSELRRLEAVREAHHAAIDSARRKLEAAVALVTSAAAIRDEAADQHERFKNLPARAVSESDVVSSKLRHARESAVLRATEANRSEIEAELVRLEREIEVRNQEVAAAGVAVRRAELDLARTRIPAPSDGRVWRLLAAPGQKKILESDDPDSSTVAVIYDPAKLQVRVDVPLVDAANLQVGQPVRLRCGMLPDLVLRGEVTGIGGGADVQRNTLQAKVRMIETDERLRPDMLCRAEFLETGGQGETRASAGQAALWVPGRALAGSHVWVVDPESKRAQRRAVVVSSEARDGYRRVLDGLRAGEWVALQPDRLREGGRVNPKLMESP